MCLGIPGRLVSIDDLGSLPVGAVDFGGLQKTINLAFTPEAKVGDYVLVHVGFSLSVIRETEADEIRKTLNELETGKSL